MDSISFIKRCFELNRVKFHDLGFSLQSNRKVNEGKKDHGYVNVGTDHETSESSVVSIRRWRNELGKKRNHLQSFSNWHK